jgi:hypothetical protein
MRMGDLPGDPDGRCLDLEFAHSLETAFGAQIPLSIVIAGLVPAIQLRLRIPWTTGTGPVVTKDGWHLIREMLRRGALEALPAIRAQLSWPASLKSLHWSDFACGTLSRSQ